MAVTGWFVSKLCWIVDGSSFKTAKPRSVGNLDRRMQLETLVVVVGALLVGT